MYIIDIKCKILNLMALTQSVGTRKKAKQNLIIIEI